MDTIFAAIQGGIQSRFGPIIEHGQTVFRRNVTFGFRLAWLHYFVFLFTVFPQIFGQIFDFGQCWRILIDGFFGASRSTQPIKHVALRYCFSFSSRCGSGQAFNEVISRIFDGFEVFEAFRRFPVSRSNISFSFIIIFRIHDRHRSHILSIYHFRVILSILGYLSVLDGTQSPSSRGFSHGRLHVQFM